MHFGRGKGATSVEGEGEGEDTAVVGGQRWEREGWNVIYSRATDGERERVEVSPCQAEGKKTHQNRPTPHHLQNLLDDLPGALRFFPLPRILLLRLFCAALRLTGRRLEKLIDAPCLERVKKHKGCRGGGGRGAEEGDL